MKEIDGSITLKQNGLVKKIRKVCGMEKCNSKTIPANKQPIATDKYGPSYQKEWEYGSVAGILLYLSSNSRPNIQFAVHQCALFMRFPRKSHKQGILSIYCYVDANFAELWAVENQQNIVSVKYWTSYGLMLGGCPLIWVSRLQTEIALYTVEAEYIALSQSMRDLQPMCRILEHVSKSLELKFAEQALMHSTVFEDNNGALGFAQPLKITLRTKHIGVKYSFLLAKLKSQKGL